MGVSAPDATENPYADLRVLLHWHAMPVRRTLSRRQVTIGPFYEDAQGADGVTSLKTPLGMYDVKEIVDRLPGDQRPDVFVAMLDATKGSVPRNLAALDCPSVLAVGDTHHLEAPIRFMISVLAAEPYAMVVGTHLAQHLHFLFHAARGKIAWIPGIWVENHALPFLDRRTHGAVFVGQVGAYHPYRTAGLEFLQRAGVPVEVGQLPAPDAARRYGEAVATLNFSLNGDLNMRVFEALGHGGCLLTDRLAPETGLYRLFRDGEELQCYDGFDDLAARLRRFLDRPQDALEIARRGFDAYRRDHLPQLKFRQLFSTLLGDSRFPSPPWEDRRAERMGSDEPQGLAARALVYEYLQERHRTALRLNVTATRGIGARMLTDLADLPRLSVRRWCDAGAAADPVETAIARLGFAARIVRVDAPGQEDVLLVTAADLQDARLQAVRPRELIFADPCAVPPWTGYTVKLREPVVWTAAT